MMTGLGNCKLGLVGASSIQPSISEFFTRAVGLPIFDVYGMTENFGLSHCNTERWRKIGTVGRPNPYCNASLSVSTGEILVGSRATMAGYMHSPEQTADMLGPNGVVRTGDIGAVDDDGFVTVVGRIKELIITAGGEKVAPVIIEDNIKSESSAFSNAVVVGEGRKFLSVLLTLTTAADGDGGYTDKLVGAAADVDSKCTTVGDASTSDVWMHYIDGAIERANANAISRMQQVKKWGLLPTDLSILGGELGPTLKLVRPAVTQTYAKLIDSFYGVISKTSVTRKVKIKRKKKTESLGFGIAPDDALHRINKVLRGSPASKAGIKSGDAIVKVSGKNVVGKSHSEVIAILKNSGVDTKLTLAALDVSPSKSKPAGAAIPPPVFTTPTKQKAAAGTAARKARPRGSPGAKGAGRGGGAAAADSGGTTTSPQKVGSLKKKPSASAFAASPQTHPPAPSAARVPAVGGGGGGGASTAPVSAIVDGDALVDVRVARTANESLGIGLEVGSPIHELTDVTPGSPAHRAGAKVGDVIVEVNGQNVTDKTHADVVSTLVVTQGEVLLRLSPSPARPLSSSTRSQSAAGELEDVIVDIPPPAEPGHANYFQSSSPVSNKATYNVGANVNVAVPPSPGFVVSTGPGRRAGTKTISLRRKPGESLGLGLERSTAHRVSQVSSGSPAKRAAVKKGDRIVAVGGFSVEGMRHHELVAALRRTGNEFEIQVVPVDGDFDQVSSPRTLPHASPPRNTRGIVPTPATPSSPAHRIVLNGPKLGTCSAVYCSVLCLHFLCVRALYICAILFSLVVYHAGTPFFVVPF